MNRDIKWKIHYDEVWEFVNKNHRSPSRHHLEEKKMLNWLKYNRKMLNRDALSDGNKEEFLKLKSFISSFNRVNQYK